MDEFWRIAFIVDYGYDLDNDLISISKFICKFKFKFKVY
jgi:hypothetical protein